MCGHINVRYDYNGVNQHEVALISVVTWLIWGVLTLYN